jgi:hypothetical protein
MRVLIFIILLSVLIVVSCCVVSGRCSEMERAAYERWPGSSGL